MLPFLFSALSMGAVGRAAMAMIEEVRRQFRDIPELRAGSMRCAATKARTSMTWSAADRAIFEAADGKAEYGKCVEISTKAAIREMVKPGLLAVAAPVIVGFVGGGAHARRPAGRRHRHRRADGPVPIQCRRCMGQRQEDVRGRLRR
jgi:K(+)-stimulated pyrophosphate-energized sodium pump